MFDKIKTYKGVNKDLTAYGGFKYVPGKEYECAGKIVACGNGFHACERPLDVLSYYAPATSRYFEAEQYGELSRENTDSKVASRKIKIGAEIGIPGLVKAHIEYVKAHTTAEYTDPDQATAGDSGAATAGDRGAATAGDSGAATSRGLVSVGKNGCGLVRGYGIKARGGVGSILVFCVENQDDFGIKEWKAAEVDGESIKADTWYTLKDGLLVEVEE